MFISLYNFSNIPPLNWFKNLFLSLLYMIVTNCFINILFEYDIESSFWVIEGKWPFDSITIYLFKLQYNFKIANNEFKILE